LLAQNSVQNLFEFEVCHHWASINLDKYKNDRSLAEFWSRQMIFGHRLWGANRADRIHAAALDRKAYPFLNNETGYGDLHELRELVLMHERKLSRNTENYGGKQGALPTIVITETPVSGIYIARTVDNLAVVTVSNWQKYLAPPSVLEFLLLNVERLAVRVAIKPDMPTHYPTRACIGDFTPCLVDFKATILVGHLCSDCTGFLSTVLNEHEMNDLRHLVSHKWLGKLDDLGSVASNLKRVYEYDLSRTRGLRPSLVERATDILWSSDVVKAIWGLLVFLIISIAASHPILWILGKLHIHI
jgi:hypothetical protein